MAEARRLMGQVETVSTVEELDALEDLVTVLSGKLSSIAATLPSYDLRTALLQIRQASDACTARREQLTPRLKFKFSSRRPIDSMDRPAASGEQAPDMVKERTAEPSAASHHFSLQNVTGETLSLQTGGRPVLLSQLSNCTITVDESVPLATLSELKGCTIRLSAVCAALFVSQCSDCVIEASCRQLRVHTTHDTRFSLWVSSTPIIEDSNGLLFSQRDPHNRTFDSSSLNEVQVENQWDRVQDFSWLRKDRPSSNWSTTTV